MQNKKFLIAASLSLALAGCGGMGANTSMYSVHQPVVERTNYTIDINSSGGVSAAEQHRVSEWFDAMQLGYGDRIAIDYGDGYRDAAVKQAVADLASEHAMLVSETAPVTAGVVAPGTFRIVVTRSSASVPSCPDWSRTNEANYNASNHSNYGCATNSNLAAMVADPEDLVRGRETKPLDKHSGNQAIKTHRAKTSGE